MISIKKSGFTLLEVLAAILIVGIIAILTLPSLTKSIQDKTRMALLKGTVSTVDNLVQKDLSKHRSEDILLTDMYKTPHIFLEKLELAKSGKPFAQTYKKYSNSSTVDNVLIPAENTETEASALLKNGVGLGIINDPEKKCTIVVVDVTGEDKPNMVGVDYFIFKVEWNDNYEEGYRAGDVTSFKFVDKTSGEEKKDEIRTKCEDGNGAACFRLVALSAYNPEYLR